MADFLLLTKVLLYVAAVVGGLAVAVTVGLTAGNFHGCCILYAPIVEDTASPTYQWLIKCSSNSNCHFPIGVGVAAVVYGVIYGGYCAYTLISRTRNGKDMVVLPSLLLNGVLSLLTLVCGAMVSVGYNNFCAQVKDVIFYGYEFGTCSHYQSSAGYKKGDNDGMPFDTFMTAAQISLWALFGVWTVLTGLTILRMRLNSREGRPATLPKLPWKRSGNDEMTSPVI
ncbi:Hypp2567 [Branchiostoma lanceolatum]|uniref:Hypp2567 protein n=1 Tax=Branchiostoma lanceolatum TaxID=7740 RepID=A0A8J9ZSL3_BRALA|nr:Hypp2567 [Branchiostoma lanceolatum]